MDTVTEIIEMPSEASPTPEPTPESEGLAGLLTAAVDVARGAVVEFSGDTVGDYLGVTCEDSYTATHRFLAEVPGYRGWQWAVVVAGYPGADHVTISEVVLVPGPTALLAPPWVPWDQRVKPGDLGPGDLLAPPPDDARLVPGYLLSGDPAVDEVAAEVGLGRKTVLSLWGRADAAQRWQEGDFGPDSAMARSTRRVCGDCGYLLPLAGSLGTMFVVCSNDLSADGHVVDFGYGCGAHSDTPAPAGTGSPLYDPYDDGVLDVDANPRSVAEVDAEAEVESAEVVETPVAEAEAVESEAAEAEAADEEAEVVDEVHEPEIHETETAAPEEAGSAESDDADAAPEIPAED